MFFAGYKGYDNPDIDWYEEHQIERLNPLKQTAQAYARVYHLDEFTRADNWAIIDKLEAAFRAIEEVKDTLLFEDAAKVRGHLNDAMTEIEVTINRLEV